LAAANKPQYQRLIDVAIQFGKKKGGDLDAQTEAALDRLVNFHFLLVVYLWVAHTDLGNLKAGRIWQGDSPNHSRARVNGSRRSAIL
jgi:hypothetical protein